MINRIPYGKQYIDKSDLQMVTTSLQYPLITMGNFVKKFEIKLSKFLRVKNVISCSSGTAALHLSFMALDVKMNDVIIMPAVNFIAAYSMCKQLGVKIYLADVDSKTGQMTPESLLECIKINKINKVKIILTMYMGGFPENIIEFYKIKKKFNCFLIEDACHAFGAEYSFDKKLVKVGSCKHSDISTFSFHPLKPITTAEGGAITTNNKILAAKIRNLRAHGINRDQKLYWKYDISKLGYNYRLSDINSALGISQIKKINKFLKKRKKIYENYKTKLNNFKNVINFPNYNLENKPSYHLVLINVDFEKLRSNKDLLLKFLLSKNIICQFHYIPIYKFSLKKNSKKVLKNSEKYFKTTLSIPIYHELNKNMQNKVIKTIKSFIQSKKFR